MFNLDKLLTEWNAVLIVAVWVLIQSLRKALPAQLGPKGAHARLLPLMPIAMCVAATFIPGPWLAPDELLGQRIALGVVLGAIAANGHTIASKLGLQAFLGLEVDETKARARKAARAEPAVVVGEPAEPEA